jgi:hypothetical protein
VVVLENRSSDRAEEFLQTLRRVRIFLVDQYLRNPRDVQKSNEGLFRLQGRALKLGNPTQHQMTIKCFRNNRSARQKGRKQVKVAARIWSYAPGTSLL